jgi:hypothetical protein
LLSFGFLDCAPNTKKRSYLKIESEDEKDDKQISKKEKLNFLPSSSIISAQTAGFPAF